MKNIIFCADDYGQNTTISKAIIELLEKKRLTATSCLVTSDVWLEHAKWLEPLKNQADIGLHFNLTEGNPSSPQTRYRFCGLFPLLKKAMLRQLNRLEIEQELHAQLDRFVAGMGCLPDFLDGHQHIHHFPVIRDAVFNVYEQRLRQSGAYMRCVHNPRVLLQLGSSGYVKKVIIELSGAYSFKKALVQRQIPHNSSFAGIYDFADAQQYAKIFPEFLAQVKEGGMIMCHPGLQGKDASDVIAAARFLEYQYLLTMEKA